VVHDGLLAIAIGARPRRLVIWARTGGLPGQFGLVKLAESAFEEFREIVPRSITERFASTVDHVNAVDAGWETPTEVAEDPLGVGEVTLDYRRRVAVELLNVGTSERRLCGNVEDFKPYLVIGQRENVSTGRVAYIDAAIQPITRKPFGGLRKVASHPQAHYGEPLIRRERPKELFCGEFCLVIDVARFGWQILGDPYGAIDRLETVPIYRGRARIDDSPDLRGRGCLEQSASPLDVDSPKLIGRAAHEVGYVKRHRVDDCVDLLDEVFEDVWISRVAHG